jgi:hypothetical protein
VVRPDDAPENIVTRMRLYHERTEPLTAFYRARGLLVPVDAEGPRRRSSSGSCASLGGDCSRRGGGMIEGLV